jgi:hypothetical protein
MEWCLILSAFVVGEISGMWRAAMMTPASRSDEDTRPVDNQAAKVRRSWKKHATPVLIKLKTRGSTDRRAMNET